MQLNDAHLLNCPLVFSAQYWNEMAINIKLTAAAPIEARGMLFKKADYA